MRTRYGIAHSLPLRYVEALVVAAASGMVAADHLLKRRAALSAESAKRTRSSARVRGGRLIRSGMATSQVAIKPFRYRNIIMICKSVIDRWCFTCDSLQGPLFCGTNSGTPEAWRRSGSASRALACRHREPCSTLDICRPASSSHTVFDALSNCLDRVQSRIGSERSCLVQHIQHFQPTRYGNDRRRPPLRPRQLSNLPLPPRSRPRKCCIRAMERLEPTARVSRPRIASLCACGQAARAHLSHSRWATP